MAPMISYATVIFIIVILDCLSPKAPFFLRKLINNNAIVNVADIDEAKAKPPIPKYRERIKFKIMLRIIPMAALVTGVLVSCMA